MSQKRLPYPNKVRSLQDLGVALGSALRGSIVLSTLLLWSRICGERTALERRGMAGNRGI